MRFTLALLALAASPALAQVDGLPATATFDARVAACVPGHRHGPIQSVTRLADGETIQGIFKDKKKVLFTTITGGDCATVYPIEKASARLKGAFDAKGEVIKAFTMTQSAGNCPSEDEGGCSELLVLKDKAGAYRAAAVVPNICARPELTAVSLFSKGHQGILLRCHISNGGDMWASWGHLFGFTATGLKDMLDVKLGYSESAAGTPEAAKRADKGAGCEIAAPGSLKVVSVGSKPAVIVREASFGDPSAKLKHSRRVWNGKAFTPDGAPIEVAQERRVICRD